MKILLLIVTILAGPADAVTRYTLPHLVTAYRETDRIVVDIAYALPRAGVAASGGRRDVVSIEQSISVVDSLGESYHDSWARPASLPPAGTSGLRRNYLLARDRVVLPHGEYDLHLGVRDLKVKSTGSFHARIAVPAEYGPIALSDLLLATEIRSPGDDTITREHLGITPNPLRLFRAGERVYVYLELYNLKRDTFGQTDFEIAYRMARPEEDELDAALFEALDRTEKQAVRTVEVKAYLVPSKHRSGVRVEKTWKDGKGYTTVATRYVGDSETDRTYLEFDISQMPDGIHKLTIRATDQRTKESAEKSVLFRVLTDR